MSKRPPPIRPLVFVTETGADYTVAEGELVKVGGASGTHAKYAGPVKSGKGRHAGRHFVHPHEWGTKFRNTKKQVDLSTIHPINDPVRVRERGKLNRQEA